MLIYRKYVVKQKYWNLFFKSFRQIEMESQPPIPVDITTNCSDFEPKQYPYRWIIVGVFSLLTFVTGIITSDVYPIGNTLCSIYNVDSATVNSIAILYSVLYALFNFPANYYLDEKGIRSGVLGQLSQLLIGCVMYVIGGILKSLVNQNFYLLIIGSIFSAIGQPFVFNAPAKLATFWFIKQNRTQVINVVTLLNLIGVGVGFILPTIFIDQTASTYTQSSQVFQMELAYLIIEAICLGLVLIFMQNKPQTPPSLGSSIQKIHFKDSLKQLVNNKQFLYLLFGYTFFIGPLNVIASIINFLIAPYGYSNSQISYIAIALLLAGIVGSTVASCYISVTLKYTSTIRFFCLFAIILYVSCCVELIYNNQYLLVIILFALAGFFITPLFPVSYDFGCQIAFPVGEAQINGLLVSSGLIFALILLLIVQFSIGFGTKSQSNLILIIFTVVTIVGALFYFLLENNLLRRDLEKKQKNKDQPAITPTEIQISK